MKRIQFFILASMAVFMMTACGSGSGNDGTQTDSIVHEEQDSSDIYLAEEKKYGIKSGIVTFEASGSEYMKGAKDILYFDDFGLKEVIEGYKDGKLIDKVICNGDGFLYEVRYEEKICKKSKSSVELGVAERFSYSPTEWSDFRKGEYKFKMEADIQLAGKTCKSYSTYFMDINKKFAGWKSILLLKETKFKSMDGEPIEETKTAVKFDENVEIPATVWEIPKNFKIIEQ